MKAKPNKTDGRKTRPKPQRKAAKRAKAVTPEAVAPEPKTMAKAKKRTEHQDTTKEELFVRGLLLRGEAVPPPPPGEKMPRGATHVVVEDEKGVASQVKRVRFSTR